MARRPMVTRHIKSTIVKLMVVDTVTKETETTDCILPRTYKSEDAIIKFIKKECVLAPTKRVVCVLDSQEVENFYGMPEEEFVKVAKVID